MSAEFKSVCGRCTDTGWVCEAHPERPWELCDCGGTGMPCPLCNASDPPKPPPGFKPTYDKDAGWRH
jgi:hypothetical protein